MRLSEFLLSHREQILLEWDEFARSCLPVADGLEWAAIRDHASQILRAMAADLKTKQSKQEQIDKSKGESDADADPSKPDTAAQAHGSGRAASGFTVEQMVSEYRALRASVIRLWTETAGKLGREDIEDLIRFNEAIDQDLAESTARFTADLGQSKEIFIAMLGHDLRTPLGAIIGAAHIILKNKDLPEVPRKMASLILSSGNRMNTLVGDLLDFTQSRLGGGIPIERAAMNMTKACRQVVEEMAAMHPQRLVNFEASGDLQGQWDSGRVSQILSNLLSNAVQYGTDKMPINVTLSGDADQVRMAVQNGGPVIPRDQLSKIFDPMHRVDGDKPAVPRSNLGLGLYIAERIVTAHGGKISVESSEDQGTTFTVQLPKRLPQKDSPLASES